MLNLFAVSLSILPTLFATVEPCQAYTVDTPGSGFGYEEINNCPLVNGAFSNTAWNVKISHWEPAAYLFKGVNLKTGDAINLMDFDIAGTTSRPQYRFHQGNITYIVTFQYTDPNTIRLEIYEDNTQILNQLLNRYPDPSGGR